MLAFSTPVAVRFRDLDALGHVNHAVYLTYMEVARQAYWFALTGSSSVDVFGFVIGKVECTYRSPAVLGDTVVVHLGVTRMGGASFTMAYRLTEQATGRLLAEATTELVCYDHGRKRARRLSAEERQAFEAFEASLCAPRDVSPPSDS